MQRPASLAALILMGLAAGAACMNAAAIQTDHPHEHPTAKEEMAVKHAVCVLQPTKGSQVRGVVHFTTLENGQVRVEAQIEGLEPGSNHGFHVHQYGDLTDESGKSLGGHYNPEGHDHGLPAKEMRHAGDLGNLTAGDDGKAVYSATLGNFSLGGHNDVIGRGIIVHAAPDDGGQPTGNAGARAAMGVIGIAE